MSEDGHNYTFGGWPEMPWHLPWYKRLLLKIRNYIRRNK